MGTTPVLSHTPPPARRRLLVGLAFAPLLLVLAWQIGTAWFLCDDAFIAFRYARNLADGHGLVFNRGERVEGFVHLSWVLELAGLWRLGVRPEIASLVLSLAFTAGTLALVVASAVRLVDRTRAAAAGWIAFAFVACSASFAVWSTGGLETRQFTFLVLAGIWRCGTRETARRRLIAASLLFAAAELTRPEGLLVFGCALGWRLLQDRAAGAAAAPHLRWLALPFTAVVALHFLTRHAYFGEWLPNPYHAKHVQPWYEAGVAYVAAAAIELGAWVWIPLGLSTAARGAARRDLGPALPFVVVGAHVLYLLRIGGDHFEFRPMDFYLPLVAGPAAAGLLHLGDAIASLLRVRADAHSARGTQLALAAAVPALLYCHGIGSVSLAAPLPPPPGPGEPWSGARLDAGASPLLVLPGLLPLGEALTPLRTFLYAHAIAAPAAVHRELGRSLCTRFAAAERLPDGVFPPSAVAAAVSVGVMPFYLRELTVVDIHGLTDATVARTPVPVDNDGRRMAHDRLPPAGYLRRRGVNVQPAAVVPTAAAALAVADFALRIDGGNWLPLHAGDCELTQNSLPADRLVARHRFDTKQAANNQVRLRGATYEGVRILSSFEADAHGLAWQTSGDAGARAGRIGRWGSVCGGVGARQLTTALADDGDAGAGTACSGTFVADASHTLLFVLGGKRAPGAHVRLCRGDVVLATFAPCDEERLQPLLVELAPWHGETLHLEVHDRGPGWVAIDHVLLVRRTEGESDPASLAWTPPPSPFAALVHVAPLPAHGGLAQSAATTITVQNPLPLPVRLRLELDGPPGASVRCGEWTPVDAGQPHDVVPAGATVRAHVHLQLAQAVDPRREPIALCLYCTPVLPPALGEAITVALDLPLTWN